LKGSSIWNTVKKAAPTSYSKWPNPFPVIEDIATLSCDDDIYIRIKMYAGVWAHWWFDNFVPSPIEITRKVVSGGYKCGFYLPVKVRSPLDIIWQDGRTSKALLQISRPLTTGLFALWATQTAWSAMDTASSLFILAQSCDQEPRSAVMGQGHAFFPASSQDGTAVFWTVFWDPEDKCDPAPGGIRFEPGGVQASWFGYLVNTGALISSFTATLKIGGVAVDTATVAPAPGESAAIGLTGALNSLDGGVVVMEAHVEQTGQGAFTTELVGTRFIVQFSPHVDPEPPGQLPFLPDPCRAPGMPSFGPFGPQA